MKNLGVPPPYQETKEGFAKWFRETAKERWENYLAGKEESVSIKDRDTLRSFLVEFGTQEEIQQKVDTLLGKLNIYAAEALIDTVREERPDLEKVDFMAS